MDKIYFYDIGVRNSIIDNFSSLEHRNDQGKLWENFLISERKKTLTYTSNYSQSYFWRTYTGAELDYVETIDDTINGYELKFKKSTKPPKSWSLNYPNASYTCINSDNFLDLLK